MKLEALRRSVVRLFRKSDTSVPPKIDRSPGGVIKGTKPQLDAISDQIAYAHEIADERRRAWADEAIDVAPNLDEIGDQILKQLIDSGVLMSKVNRAHPQAERAGIKPPLDAGTNGWTWSQWSKEVAANGTIPGWAFCRFANRLGPENVGFVFGHVRGGFGVWRQPFDVCTGHDEGVQQRSEILTCITHLRSGMGVGIFLDRDTAILAAELADRVCPGWETEAPERLWSAYMDRTLSAWHSLGICQSSNSHAHDQHGTRFPIYGQDNESVMAGKPERLS